MTRHYKLTYWLFFLLVVGLLAWGLLVCRESWTKRFHGTWRLIDQDNRTSGWLTVDGRGAERWHARGIKCRVFQGPGEYRMEWADGFRDVLKVDGESVTLIALQRWTDDWASEPRFKLRAVR